VVLCSALQACGSSSPTESEVRTDQKLEVFNWWTNPGETDALQALLKIYSERQPQTNLVNTAVPTLSKAQEELQSRMVSRSPPDTFQTLGGWGLLKWVVYDGNNDADSKMEPLDFIAKENKLADFVPASVMDLVSFGGKVYGIPLGVHRYNCLFFNKKLFDDNGLLPPLSLAEFYTVSEALKAKGLTPLAVGSTDGHQVKTQTWDGLLVAKGGAEFRESYLTGHEDPADPRIVDMLNEYARMLDYSNTDHDSLTWDAAAQMVVDGKAAMTMVGDFAKAFPQEGGAASSWVKILHLRNLHVHRRRATAQGIPRPSGGREPSTLVAPGSAERLQPDRVDSAQRRRLSDLRRFARATMDDFAHTNPGPERPTRVKNQVTPHPTGDAPVRCDRSVIRHQRSEEPLRPASK
jgi:ABC-type glycerol-3-phosphate transport system substrate-binding protein